MAGSEVSRKDRSILLALQDRLPSGLTTAQIQLRTNLIWSLPMRLARLEKDGFISSKFQDGEYPRSRVYTLENRKFINDIV